MKTKGALLWGINEKWSIEEIELGDPVAGEVQIRMEAAGMCHSDHHIVTGATPMASYPAMGGHEGAGVITKVGEGVKDLEVGDHVVLSFIPACGRCPSCSEGHSNAVRPRHGAAQRPGHRRRHLPHPGSRRERHPDVPARHVLAVHDGARVSVVKIEKDIPFELAALVGCGVPTGWGSATNVADVKPGDSVAIIGVGGVGMSALQGSVASGARHVFAIDPVAVQARAGPQVRRHACLRLDGRGDRADHGDHLGPHVPEDDHHGR